MTGITCLISDDTCRTRSNVSQHAADGDDDEGGEKEKGAGLTTIFGKVISAARHSSKPRAFELTSSMFHRRMLVQ